MPGGAPSVGGPCRLHPRTRRQTAGGSRSTAAGASLESRYRKAVWRTRSRRSGSGGAPSLSCPSSSRASRVLEQDQVMNITLPQLDHPRTSGPRVQFADANGEGTRSVLTYGSKRSSTPRIEDVTSETSLGIQDLLVGDCTEATPRLVS